MVNDNSLGKLPLKIIVLITDWKEHYNKAPWMVRVSPDSQNKLTKESVADCFQIRSISEERFVSKIGSINTETFERIKESLSKVLSIEQY